MPVMPDTQRQTRQRRTAASIVGDITQRLLHEQVMLEQAQAEVLMLRTRINTLESVLKDYEKNGDAE